MMGTVYALPDNLPFNSPDQSICFVLQELDQVKLDGGNGKSDIIRQLVNSAAQEISDNTVMNIIDEPCITLDVNTIRSLDFQDEFIDGFVFSFPPNSPNLGWKEITFNTHSTILSGPHAYSSTTDCNPVTEIPNFRYISNHEFGHFAGLDHVPVEHFMQFVLIIPL